MDINWSAVAALAIIGSTAGLFGMLWIKSKLSGDFATKDEMAAINKRLGDVEHALRVAPTHKDIQGLSEKVGEAMAKVGIVAEAMSGMKDGVARIDRSVERIERHLLENNK